MPPLRRLLICLSMLAFCASLFAKENNFAETKKRAEAGDAKAQNDFGEMYSYGKGVPKDNEEAVKWYRKAAEQGHADAQNSLGLMFVIGIGVPKNESEAVKWYRKAAEQGHADAQNSLGGFYYNGRGGVQEDFSEALKWHRKAADQGNGHAQVSIGIMYQLGSGVPKNEVEAYAWYNLAAFERTPKQSSIYQDIKLLIQLEHQRLGLAIKFRDELNLTPEQVARAQKRSTELFNEIEARKKAAGK